MDAKKVLVAVLLLVGAGALYVKFGKHIVAPVKPPVEMNDPIITPPVAPPVVPDVAKPPIIPEIPEISEILASFSNYQEAIAAAKKHNRPLFLYFGAEWCGWCKKMKETLSSPEVKDKLGKEYVTCLIDTDKDRATARKYKVSGIPAYMVVDGSETVVIRDSGFKSKDDMLVWLRPKNVSLLELKD